MNNHMDNPHILLKLHQILLLNVPVIFFYFVDYNSDFSCFGNLSYHIFMQNILFFLLFLPFFIHFLLTLSYANDIIDTLHPRHRGHDR